MIILHKTKDSLTIGLDDGSTAVFLKSTKEYANMITQINNKELK